MHALLRRYFDSSNCISIVNYMYSCLQEKNCSPYNYVYGKLGHESNLISMKNNEEVSSFHLSL